MKIKMIKISPELAQQFLDQFNTRNRPLSQYHVADLAKEMTEGRWKMNGDTICFSKDALIDGQHRLAAIVKSGITIPAVVVTDVSADVFDTKDVGKRRTAADTFAINNESNYSILAAVVFAVHVLIKPGRPNFQKRPSIGELEATLNDHPGIREVVSKFPKGLGKLIPASLALGLLYLFVRKEGRLAYLFFNRLSDGSDLPSWSPVYVLREKLINNSLAKAKLNKEHIAALVIKAWNAERKGQKMFVLRWSPGGASKESFPEIM